MVHNPDLKAVFSHFVARYVHTIIPHREPVDKVRTYEEEYKCCPPAIFMITISLLEIVMFLLDAMRGKTDATGPIADVFIYDPYRRKEAWRFITYMLVHIGVCHILMNLLVQLFLGVPLEMVHKWWRVSLVYFAGVAAGSVASSLTDPEEYLAGASGGVYALITAHVATVIMNWEEMQYANIQLLVFLVIVVVDIGRTIYNRYFGDQDISTAAHLGGGLAGLLVGIGTLRNLEKLEWEKHLWWASVALYFVLMMAGILANLFWDEHFPPQDL